MYRHGELHYTYSEQYQDFKSEDYLEAFKRIIGANNPNSRLYPDLKNFVDDELAKFTGKVSLDKNEGET